MASVSAFVLLGPSHQNDNGFSPEWTVELWEGDRPKWILRSQNPGKRPKSFNPKSPPKIFDSLVELIETAYPGSTEEGEEPNGIALVVTCLGGSSLVRHLPQIRGMKQFDVHLAPVTWSRTYDTWGGRWQVKKV